MGDKVLTVCASVACVWPQKGAGSDALWMDRHLSREVNQEIAAFGENSANSENLKVCAQATSNPQNIAFPSLQLLVGTNYSVQD